VSWRWPHRLDHSIISSQALAAAACLLLRLERYPREVIPPETFRELKAICGS
jgi:hypothetical protein